MERFYYIYVLRSLKDGNNYTGYTKNLKLRLEQHSNGEVESTKDRRPFVLIYFEGWLHQQDATHREKYLKTYYGKMYLKNRLKRWTNESSNLIWQGEYPWSSYMTCISIKPSRLKRRQYLVGLIMNLILKKNTMKQLKWIELKNVWT